MLKPLTKNLAFLETETAIGLMLEILQFLSFVTVNCVSRTISPTRFKRQKLETSWLVVELSPSNMPQKKNSQNRIGQKQILGTDHHVQMPRKAKHLQHNHGGYLK